MGTGNLVEFSPFFTRELTFVLSCYLPAHKTPSEKGSFLKRNRFLRDYES